MIVNQLNGQPIKPETVINKSSSPYQINQSPTAQMSSNTSSSSSSSLSSSPSTKQETNLTQTAQTNIMQANMSLIANDPNNAAYFQAYATNFKVDLNNNTSHSQQQQAAQVHAIQQHQLAQMAASQLNTSAAQAQAPPQAGANQTAYASLINNGAYALNGLINNTQVINQQDQSAANANLIASINAANFANFVNFSNGGEHNAAAVALAVQQQQQQQQKQTVNQQTFAGASAQNLSNQHLFNCIINAQPSAQNAANVAGQQTAAAMLQAQATTAINLNDEHQLYDYMHQLLEEKEKLKELFNDPFNILLPISAKLLDEG
jgi:hypothetical protein